MKVTTNKQLQNWLARFPDDVPISVVTSKECAGHWHSYIEAYHEELVLPDVQIADLNWSSDYQNVVFDIDFDYEQPCCTTVKSITLGKAHND